MEQAHVVSDDEPWPAVTSAPPLIRFLSLLFLFLPFLSAKETEGGEGTRQDPLGHSACLAQ